ncbi:hypothetical protein [Halorarum halophilum]|nr:hypothetical protein [Halobaculum halophilum]
MPDVDAVRSGAVVLALVLVSVSAVGAPSLLRSDGSAPDSR